MKEVNFGDIALCMPGGGYRAACFSLGILSFLHKFDLLKDLKSISTVSGGTITGVKYATAVAQDIPFETFYAKFYDWLKKDLLLEKSIEVLKDKSKFKHKRQNLINSFSLVYRELTEMNFLELEKKLLEKIGEDEKSPYKRSLNDVIFNATDFENGLQFRFRTKGKKKKEKNFGNKINNFKELKEHILLSDIIAASSCFPGGFEPMSFPNDFCETIPDKTKTKNIPIGLMDGGIVDNHGILSYLTSSDNYDTYIVGDAGKEKITGFDFSEDSKLNRILSYLFSGWLFFAILLLTVALYCFNFCFLSILSAAFFGTLLFLQLILHCFLVTTRDKLNIDNHIVLPRKKIGLYLADRITSVLHMNNSIFLRGSKRSNLTLFYSELGYEKVCHSPIYKFNKKTKTNKTDPDKSNTSKPKYSEEFEALQINIPQNAKLLSEFCSNVETTLWFTDERKKQNTLDKLIQCGQLVCCHSLMENLIARSENHLDLNTNKIFLQLREEWNILNQ